MLLRLQVCSLEGLVLALMLALVMPSYVAASSRQVEARALALEKKLMAPCCWQGTLDAHHSELADFIHEEIRARLARGEAAAPIEQNLVSRFGERIVAVPSPDILEGTASVMMWGLLVAGGLLWAMARSWVRRKDAVAEPQTPEAARSTTAAKLTCDYDLLVDAELRRLD